MAVGKKMTEGQKIVKVSNIFGKGFNNLVRKIEQIWWGAEKGQNFTNALNFKNLQNQESGVNFGFGGCYQGGGFGSCGVYGERTFLDHT